MKFDGVVSMEKAKTKGLAVVNSNKKWADLDLSTSKTLGIWS